MMLFDSEADFCKPAKYQAADALVPQLEKTLAELRAACASAKAKTPGIDSDFQTAASSLISLVGAYRTMKQSKSVYDLNDMVKAHNRAVEAANAID